MRLGLLETCFVFALLLGTIQETAHAQLDGQIIVDPSNPSWLVRYNAGGDHRPLFMAGPGDPEDFLYRGSRNVDGTRSGDQWALINKLKTTGANSIYLQAVRAGGDGPADHNPFIGSNPSLGLNQDILDQWDNWFTEMDNNGIVTYFFFYDDDSAGSYYFGGGDAVPANEQAFVQGIVNRFEHHKNLIWVVKEEYTEAYSAARVSNIAATIRAADDNNHVIAVHQNDGISFDFANDSNIDQFAVQRNTSGADNIHNDMVSAWNLANGRYNLNMSESNQHYNVSSPDRQATRRYSWAAAMAGSYVMVLRDDIISTPTKILEDHGRIVDFFEQTNFNTMSPSDTLAAAGTDYVLADGVHHSYIAYAADLVDNIGLVNMVAGQYDFLWFDVVTGATVQQNMVPVSSGNQTWNTPPGLGDELAVWISPAENGPRFPATPTGTAL